MSRFDSPLSSLAIASPCSADWNEMYGDGRKRFCRDCKLNVYNLSGMTRYDAENLLRLSEGRLCVRYFLRADGTILTEDCPVGWAKIKQRVSVIATAAFSMIVSLFGSLFVVSLFSRRVEVVGQIPITRSTSKPRTVPLMGVIAMPSPTPTQKRTPSGEFEMVLGRPERF